MEYIGMKRKVYLEGELGKLYGYERTIVAPTVGDIFKCLSANFSDFSKYLVDLESKGLDLKCKVNNTELSSAEELNLLYGTGDVIISVVPAGSKSKLMKIVTGAVLIATGYGAFGALGGYLGAGTFLGGAIASYGFSLLSMGIAEYMAPDPSSADQITRDSGYVYQGSEQVIRDTDPVPICYGRMRIPAKPISFEVRNLESIITN
jgi:predicted phage tail protein